YFVCFFLQAEDGIRDFHVTGVQTCALPIFPPPALQWQSAPAHRHIVSGQNQHPITPVVQGWSKTEEIRSGAANAAETAPPVRPNAASLPPAGRRLPEPAVRLRY